MSENVTFGEKFTAEDFEKAEELDFAGRVNCAAKNSARLIPAAFPNHTRTVKTRRLL